MERAIEIYAILNFFVIGVSHVVCHRAWAAFFIDLRGRGETGVFATAFLSLAFGSLVVAFHNVWSGIPMLLTIIGWAQVVKALIYFIFPAYGLRKMEIVSAERSSMFIWPGLAFILLAGLLGYHLWVTG